MCGGQILVRAANSGSCVSFDPRDDFPEMNLFVCQLGPPNLVNFVSA